jgi:hypothetical protein
MKLGELFFDLGFKTKGIAESANFKGMIEKTKDSLENLKGSFDKSNVSQNKTLSLSLSLKNMFNGMIDITKRLALGIVGIGTSILFTMKSVSNTAMNIDVLSSSTGKSTGFLYNMKKFAAEAGVSFENMGEGLKRVKQISSDISLGKASPSAFYSALGIDPHADYERQLGQLSDAFKRFPDNLDRVRAGARDMGFSEEEIYIAQKVTNIYGKLNKEIGNEKAHQRMVAFHKRMEAFGERMTRSLGNLAMKAEPLINKIFNAIEKTVNYFSGKAGDEWGKFFDWLLKALPPIEAMLVAFALAVSPFTVGLGAALLVLKEIWQYTQGKNSIFSTIGLMPYKELIDSIKQGIESIAEVLGIEVATPEEKAEKEKSRKASKLKGKTLWEKGKSLFEMGKANEFEIKEKDRKNEEQQQKIKDRLGASNARTTNNQNINVTINESKDPKLTAQLIQKTVGDAYWQLQRGEV